jgi:predicted small metal-binding protein
MPRITCSDLGLGVCKHVIEAAEEDELYRLAREHVREMHGEDVDDKRLSAVVLRD